MNMQHTPGGLTMKQPLTSAREMAEQYPKLVAEIAAQAVQEERARLRAEYQAGENGARLLLAAAERANARRARAR
jgi:hypothetical protein